MCRGKGGADVQREGWKGCAVGRVEGDVEGRVEGDAFREDV
jgi:hypothetical protein